MQSNQNENDIDFTVDQQNLYREEAITDMKVASIRRLVPIKADGTDDTSRSSIFMGSTQLMSPEGPLPLQAQLSANNLKEAFEAFPKAMEQALNDMLRRLEQMQRQQQQRRQQDSSRIIVPGR
jgi:hypothetical protein